VAARVVKAVPRRPTGGGMGEAPWLQRPASVTEVRRVAADLRTARERVLRPRPIADVLAALAAVIERWLDPQAPLRRRAEAELPEATGFSAAMIRHGLPLMLEPLRGTAVARLLDEEIGGPAQVDHAAGTPLIVHVLSGNLPALAAAPSVLSLAIKSAALVKASGGDRVFPPLFVESIGEVDEDLAKCVAAVYWTGGRRDVETAAFGAADLVVAAGSEATVADIADRVPGRFIGHGHRISFAGIARESLKDAEEIAARLAYDVTLWDQQGCLSPQLAYVERGGSLPVEEFAAEVGRQLERLAGELPARRLVLDEQASIQRFRQEAEWRGVRGEEISVFASSGSLSWTVVYDAAPAFLPTALNRTLWIKPIASLNELADLLPPVRRYLEAAGVAAPEERRADLATILAGAGVHRICPLGEMQRPDLTWRPGGRPRVAEWLGLP